MSPIPLQSKPTGKVDDAPLHTIIVQQTNQTGYYVSKNVKQTHSLFDWWLLSVKDIFLRGVFAYTTIKPDPTI